MRETWPRVIAMLVPLTPITAEGVETESQMPFLRRHACDEAQGFLLGRPVPADRLQTETLALAS